MLKIKTNHLTYICTYMVITSQATPGYCSQPLIKGISARTFFSPSCHSLDHNSAIFPSPPQHLMSIEALKVGVKCVGDAYCPFYVLQPLSLPLDAHYLWGTNAAKIPLPNKWQDSCTRGLTLGISAEGFEGQSLL